MAGLKPQAIEVLLSTTDMRFAAARATDDDSPLRRYEVNNLGVHPARNNPMFRRHCMFPYAASITESGLAALARDRAADPLATAAGLSDGEYLGLLCGRWADAHQPGRWPAWQREIQMVGYKAERARRAKNPAREAGLRVLDKELRSRYALHQEARRHRLEKGTLH